MKRTAGSARIGMSSSMKRSPGGVCRTGSAALIVVIGLAVCSLASAYETWSENPDTDTGNCATCHGKFGFVGEKYISAHDGTVWTGDLMTGHGSSMLVGCMDCHAAEGDQPLLARCAGCHGRADDGGAAAIGAGLRQLHRVKGMPDCDLCHGKDEQTVGEHVVPAMMKARGIDPCNDAQFGPDGLDNDGDGKVDSDDSDCQKPAIDITDGKGTESQEESALWQFEKFTRSRTHEMAEIKTVP